jgi:hypothetical protein
MLVLSILTRKVKIFLNMKLWDKLLLFETFFLTAFVRLLIISVPFRKLKVFLGAYMKEDSMYLDESNYRTITRISWAVSTVSKYTPWESKCFVQAITAQWMLKRRKILSTLYLGIHQCKDENIKAHAWLKSGGIFVTGGNNSNMFNAVAKFSNEKGGK